MPINPYYNGGASFSPYIPSTTTTYPQYGTTVHQQPANTVYMVLVNSEEEAKNYQLNPGNSIFLMDSNNSVFYTKSVDFSGIVTFKKYQFHEVVDTPKPVVPDNYVTREEFEEWKKSMNRKPQYQKREVKHESIS